MISFFVSIAGFLRTSHPPHSAHTQGLLKILFAAHKPFFPCPAYALSYPVIGLAVHNIISLC